MEDIGRCGKVELEDENGRSLYTVLSEIAACDDYNVEQIGVVETIRTRSLSLQKPCVISLKDASASIGGGEVEPSPHALPHGREHSVVVRGVGELIK